MRIGVTVNLGNYENIRVESSEHEDTLGCTAEVISALKRFGDEPRIQDFISRIFEEEGGREIAQ